jgi:hypothetical protein
MVTDLSEPFDHNEPFEFESYNETAVVEMNLQLPMEEISLEPSTRKLIPK